MNSILCSIGKVMITQEQVNELMKLYKVDMIKFKYYYSIMRKKAVIDKMYNAKLFFFMFEDADLNLAQELFELGF